MALTIILVAAFAVAGILAFLAGVVATVRTSIRDRARNKRYRAYIDPAARTLFSICGVPYTKERGRAAFSLGGDWSPGDPVVINIPTDNALTAAKERQIVTALGGRLAIVSPTGSWQRAGSPVRVEIAGLPLPPAEIDMAPDGVLMTAVRFAALTRPVVGLGPNGQVLTVDYEQDSPHLAVSGPSGTGKSVLLKFILAQRMSHGAGCLILDAKRWSHQKWTKGIPQDRLIYAYLISDIHDQLVAVGEELQRRIESTEEELDWLRDVDIVVEEINSLIKMLTVYWRGRRKAIMNEAKAAAAEDMDFDEADLDPPLLSPAVAALQYAVNMGREMRMHVHVASQRLEANVFGSNSGAAVRQSFALRFIAQWDRALWKMLMSGHDYVSWPDTRRGLWGFGQGTDFHLVRVPWLDNDTARALAMSGLSSGPVLGPQDRTVRPDVSADTTLDIWTDSDGATQAVRVRLSEALDRLPGQDGPDKLSLEGLRTAIKRSGLKPLAPVAGEAKNVAHYDLQALVDWRLEKLGRVA